MPFYDYFCEANNRTVEVYHDSGTRLTSWGQLAKLAKLDLGDTPAKAKVIRLISGVTPMIFRVKGLDKDEPSDRLIV